LQAVVELIVRENPMGMHQKLCNSIILKNLVREIADNCANLQSSFGTDWFQAAA
jgi:hypothetical protein